MIKPYHAELLAFVRQRTRGRIMFHSCGSIASLLDDFIEIGMNILNPVQVSAQGMDTAVLKKRYGKRIAFWGAVDTQRVLPFGSPDDVRAEVRRRIADLAEGGGYVVAPVHVVQADVPVENILALCAQR
jgi:uroporphyrinogen decarboxylase